MKTIRHMKFPIDMNLRDPFDSLETPVLQDFMSSGWGNWIIEHYNKNQLELFDTSKYQKYDRHGRELKMIDKKTARDIRRDQQGSIT